MRGVAPPARRPRLVTGKKTPPPRKLRDGGALSRIEIAERDYLVSSWVSCALACSVAFSP
jgi:hypothetical protein